MFGIKRSRKQDVIILTGFRGIVDDSLETVEGKRYATNERNREAWAIQESTQIPDAKTGRPVQVLTGWDANPVVLFGRNGTEKETRKTIEILAARVTDESIAWFEEQKHKHTLLLWVGIIGVILALGVVIPIVTGILRGDVHIPVPNIPLTP